MQIEERAARRTELGDGHAGAAGCLRFVVPRDHPQLRHPAVVTVPDPVLAGEDREPLRAPAVSPRVLHDEAVFVVADEGERVAVVRARRPWIRNRPDPVGRGLLTTFARVPVIPAVVRKRAPEQHAGFVQCDLHVDHGTRIDPIVRAERPADAVVPPVRRARRAGLVELRPQRDRAVPTEDARPQIRPSASRPPAAGRARAERRPPTGLARAN